jgi:hypothetical protein
MLNFERNAGDPLRTQAIPTSLAGIFADLLLERERDIRRHY